MISAPGDPPGSRVTMVRNFAASRRPARILICVDLPEPSPPSKVMKRPRSGPALGAASVIADYILRTGRIIDLTKDHIVIKRDRNLERNEVLFIVDGEGELEVDGETRPVAAGDAILIPPGSWHELTAGVVGVRLLCCCVPPYSDDDTHFA